MRLALALLVCFPVLGVPLSSKGQALINGDLEGMKFGRFAQALESETSYRFFFDPATTDTITIDTPTRGKALNVILDEVFAGTNFHYAIDSVQVYVTLGREILTRLPEDFFGTASAPSTKPQESFDYSLYEKRERQVKSAETQIHSIGSKSSDLRGVASIAGHLRDIADGEPVIGASIYIEKPLIGVATDQFGYYSITLPKGRHELTIHSIGMKPSVRQIMLYADGKLDIEIEEEIAPLKEVIVESERDIHVSGVQMGVEKLDIRTMKQMPLALGETDIMKVVLTLPGVQTVGEGTVGLNVRGGATNQNLILFNDATIYNPSHLFGFFSTFNPDVLKNVELYKSGITADYGGRISSVLDATSREGNLKKFSGSGGISPITGRFTLEGPIVKDRTSLLVGGRSTYSDWLLGRLDSKKFSSSSASFYDLNLGISHKIDDRNNLHLSAYASQDKFRLASDTLYGYADKNASVKWKHIFNNKLYGVLTGAYSHYNYSITSQKNPVNAFEMKFGIRQVNANADFSYFLNPKHTVNAGAGTIHYTISPGDRKPLGDESRILPDRLQLERAQESAVYLGDTFEVNPSLSLYFGLRYSLYQYLGPRDLFIYADGVSRTESSILDTLHHPGGKPVISYSGAEPRASLRYSVSRTASFKVSYNLLRQYLQMLSNTTAITPTDVWKLSDPYVRPQIGSQISAGFYKHIKGNTIEFSLESYYKTMQNSTDFKNAAVLFMNHHIETDLINSRAKAYGVEMLLKKNSGRLNGWISYTYSRSWLQSAHENPDETVNNGNYYPSGYDKPHAVNFVSNYKFSRRFNFSMNMTYSTGRPVTLPLAVYELGGAQRLFYSDRNKYRIPDYFRTDASINVEGNHKIKKLAHGSWTFAVYNLTGRKNAYSVFFTTENGTIKGYKLSVFAQPIPTITYNFKF